MASIFRESVDNFEVLSNRSFDEDPRTRDVFKEQQTEREGLPQAQTAVTRVVAAVALTIAVAIAMWLLISVLEMVWYYLSHGHGGAGVASMATMNQTAGLPSFGYFLGPSLVKIIIEFVTVLAFFVVVYTLLMRNLDLQNALTKTSDINSYTNDGHVQMPAELVRTYDFFPDAGAHSSVQPSSMLSHIALSNKGLKKIEMVDRKADKSDDSEFYAILEEDYEDLDFKKVPFIDKEFGEALFKASGLPRELNTFMDPTSIPYNPDNENREKLKNYDTLADLVNGDWDLPYYEPQRPAGAYVVDTAPVNTMVLAITRAGKGQTVIEPTIDMWLREREYNNMVINDPKGELLVRNYVPATVRGFQPVQFNLINYMKTDIYNPLALAIQAAREGNQAECSRYVEALANVFFPVDGADDPVWPNAAANAFRRAAFGMIDYYYEEERMMRRIATRKGTDPGVLETMIDESWGKVTLYNCYQLFVQLTSKKEKDPAIDFDAQYKKWQESGGDESHAGTEGKFAGWPASKVAEEKQRVAFVRELFNGAQEIDQLSLYFAATGALPSNSVRDLVRDADNSLKAMGGAEKMLASVYGIAITAMAFFTDPVVATLTSGTPSQNVDLAGLSFPRRIWVRLHPEYCRRYHLIGLQAVWQAYADPAFEESLGKEFYHEDIITMQGWARFMFKGIFPEDKAYLKLELRNPQTGVLVKTFYFRFRKSYQRSLDGRFYVTDPILMNKIVRNGVITELRPKKDASGKTVYVRGKRTFSASSIEYVDGEPKKVDVDIPAIVNETVRYSEKPKVVFLVTPPHLMKYAKLLLILIKQLVDLNFDQSYMTKPNQKPLYKTRYMLDELGNLQSEGHGIDGFETMLSIGLGQDQQFTLILQTLQQLRDVYGESVDKIVQGNAQPLHSLIATPSGWKRMGDIAVGDEVVTPKGTNAQVKGVYPRGKRAVYRVTLADGSSCLCCNEHLWKVKIS